MINLFMMRNSNLQPQAKDYLFPNLRQPLGIYLPGKPIVLMPMNPRQTEQFIAKSRNGNDISTLLTNILSGPRTVFHQMGTGKKKTGRKCLQLFVRRDTADLIGLGR